MLSVEFYNDKMVKRVIKQLEKYIKAMSQGYPSIEF